MKLIVEGVSLGIDRLTCFDQLLVPGSNSLAAFLAPQCGISLPQCFAVSAPAIQKAGFHVKHPPIKEPPTVLRSPLD